MPLPQRYPTPVTVQADGLACRRGGRPIFVGVSFTAGPGQLLALTGPNGSGKSSLLRMLAGLIRPDAGNLRSGAGQGTGNGGLHYLGHLDALKPALTLAETLRFWAVLCGSPAPAQDAISGAAEEVGLGRALYFPTSILSAGQRRRAGLARLLVAPQPLWLLDEPAAALDAGGEALLGTLMRQHLQAGGTIIAATHGPLPVAAAAMLEFGAEG